MEKTTAMLEKCNLKLSRTIIIEQKMVKKNAVWHEDVNLECDEINHVPDEKTKCIVNGCVEVDPAQSRQDAITADQIDCYTGCIAN
jgi:hypothetical protein